MTFAGFSDTFFPALAFALVLASPSPALMDLNELFNRMRSSLSASFSLLSPSRQTRVRGRRVSERARAVQCGRVKQRQRASEGATDCCLPPPRPFHPNPRLPPKTIDPATERFMTGIPASLLPGSVVTGEACILYLRRQARVRLGTARHGSRLETQRPEPNRTEQTSTRLGYTRRESSRLRVSSFPCQLSGAFSPRACDEPPTNKFLLVCSRFPFALVRLSREGLIIA